MMQFVIAAPRSGSGKTTVTCALLAALKKRGMGPCAFKSGPDYIDPMFHRAVLGVESRSLDLFFSAPETVRTLYAKGAAGHGAAVCEGAMGFYDGLGGVSDRASAWHLADTLGLPVLLVVEAKGSEPDAGRRAERAEKLPHSQPHRRHPAEQLHGTDARSAGSDAGKRDGPAGAGLSAETPGGRHRFPPSGPLHGGGSGKFTAEAGPSGRRGRGAHRLARLLALCEKEPPALPVQPETPPARVRIAVAQDEAFCFTYAETLDALRDAGAELVLFSPVQDAALPENIGGLYLPGGYPELYAKNSERKQNHAGFHPAGRAGGPAHSSRMRRLFVSGPEP